MAIEPVIVETKPAPASAEVKPVETTPTPAVETKPVETAAPAPAPEAKPVSAEPETLIGTAQPAKKAEETKPADTKPVETKPAEVKPVEPAKPEPGPETKPEVKPLEKHFTFEPYKVPEGLALDNDRVTGLNSILTEFAPDEASARGLGQKLIDFYMEDVKLAQEAQKSTWDKTQADWRAEIKADPEIGGNRSETVIQQIGGLIDNFGGDAASQKALRSAFNFTGAGNNPHVVRFLSRIGKALTEGTPTPALKPAAPPASRATRRYGGNGAAQP